MGKATDEAAHGLTEGLIYSNYSNVTQDEER